MQRTSFKTIGSLCTLILWVGWVTPSWSAAQGSEETFSYGSGPIEVFIFSDFFCPSCEAVEPYLEGALAELLRLGAKVTFVVKPITKVSPIYGKYYLYAAKGAENFAEVLRIRRVLFEIAKANVVASERALVQKLKENQIKLSLFEIKPVFDRWTELIMRYDIKSTPFCVVTQPDRQALKFKGRNNMAEGLDQLIAAISKDS